MRFDDWKTNNLPHTREYVWDEMDDTPTFSDETETELDDSLAFLRGVAISAGGFIELILCVVTGKEIGALLRVYVMRNNWELTS
jgi:hypothetical protein